jgi:hypothetical protein
MANVPPALEIDPVGFLRGEAPSHEDTAGFAAADPEAAESPRIDPIDGPASGVSYELAALRRQVEELQAAMRTKTKASKRKATKNAPKRRKA